MDVKEFVMGMGEIEKMERDKERRQEGKARKKERKVRGRKIERRHMWKNEQKEDTGREMEREKKEEKHRKEVEREKGEGKGGSCVLARLTLHALRVSQ